jgi:hypothetical protein
MTDVYTTVYKVVMENFDGTFFSCHTKSGILYRIGEVAIPKYGKIFCFPTLEDAIAFKKGRKYAIISGCGKNPKGIKFACMAHCQDELFWKFRKNKKKFLNCLTVPKHTIVVDNFRPDNVIERA